MSTTTRAVFPELATAQEDRRPVRIHLRGELRLEVDGRRLEGGLPGSLGPVSRILGLLAAARGERDAAVGHLEDALSRSEAVGVRLFETQARAELDELLTPSG